MLNEHPRLSLIVKDDTLMYLMCVKTCIVFNSIKLEMLKVHFFIKSKSKSRYLGAV